MSFNKASCPSCGASVDIFNPGIIQFTCNYCNSVIHINPDGLKDSGKKSQLIASISGLAMDTMGTLLGKSFRVIGRVQYGWSSNEETGEWDEWFIEYGDQNAWLSEDMGVLRFEKEISSFDIDRNIPVGETILVDKNEFLIMEKNRAKCIGAQGQLPFQVIPDEEYDFVDGVDTTGKITLTVEFDGDQPKAFSGSVIKKGEIKYEKSVSSAGSSSKSVNCKSCNAPLQLTGNIAEIQTIVCSYCGAFNNPAKGRRKDAGLKIDKTLADVFYLKHGAVGQIRDVEWHIAGRMRYDWVDEGERGYDLEYLLYNEKEGYAWLHEANGHYSLAKVHYPNIKKSLFSYNTPKAAVNVDKQRFLFFEKGQSQLKYVDGALPWVATIGTTSYYAEAINPPFIITQESAQKNGDGEIEFYLGEYIPKTEIETGFKITLPRSYSVAPSQPFIKAKGMMLPALFSLFMFIGTCAYTGHVATMGQTILSETIPAEAIDKKDRLSAPFEIRNPDETLAVELKVPVDNSSTDIGLALYNEEDGAVIDDREFEVSYYYGGSGDDAWSEGSREDTTFWKIKNPGVYRILLTSFENENYYGNYGVTVEKGVQRTWPFFLSCLAWFFTTLWFLFGNRLRKISFETQRWRPVMPDDDDD